MSWNYDPHGTNCEDCRETYRLEKLDPPCGSCKKPEDIDPENMSIVNLWQRCSNSERDYSDMSGTPKRLKTGDIIPVCELYGCSRGDLERVLLIESVVYPFLMEAAGSNNNPYGSNYHPNVGTSINVAEDLADFISTITGREVIRDMISND